MKLYFGGSEVPSWRTLLAEEHVDNVAMSYMGLRRRVNNFSRPWSVAEKFPDFQNVFLDSGAYTVNNAEEDKYTQADLKQISAQYQAFVMDNIDRISLVTEFDSLSLGRDFIAAAREDFYDDLPDDKFIPVWHGEWGLDELDRLARKYKRVGVFSTEMGGRNITPFLNSLVQKYGTLLHGVNMSKSEDMAAVEWDTISTISWISPSQYGDTIVWTGRELKRYPKAYKDRARKRHRTLFDREGFDSALIEADDSKEVLRVSIWSWRQVEAHKNGEVVSASPKTDDEGFPQPGGVGVEIWGSETLNEPATNLPIVRRDPVPLPGMGIMGQKEVYTDPDDGSRKEREIPLLIVRSESMRECRSCFLAKQCPMFDVTANCAYNIPIEVRTRDQVKSVQNALIEMQTQRVLFMRMAEDMSGGYADPNLSSEIDRLQKLMKVAHEMDQEGFSLKIEAKGSDSGVISRLFGREAGETAKQLPYPLSVERVVDIVDADLVESS